MKFSDLKSVGHNIADSLASGIGLLIGVYETDIFGEAANSDEGHITVDFLTGAAQGATPSKSLKKAIELYSEALPALCAKHGVSPSDFAELTARFSVAPYGRRFAVTVEDQHGRQSTQEYMGSPGKRTKIVDELGRIRPKESD